MTERCLDDVLTQIPAVRRHSRNQWAKGFAGSIMRQSRRTSWRPSPKQEAIMRRLVSELFTARDEEDVELIEEG